MLNIEGKAGSWKGERREERGPATVKPMGLQVGPCAHIFPVCHVHRERRAQELGAGTIQARQLLCHGNISW